MVIDEMKRLLEAARGSFQYCISLEENRLQASDELGFPPEAISVKIDFIKIQFNGPNDERLIEVRLKLNSPAGNNVGYYAYQENESGEFVDEFLVFY
jgi:hypothetical protein